jgi:hypothetical protein
VVGDGSINCVSYPEGARGLASAAAAVLRRDGLLVLRCYVQSQPREDASCLLTQALAGEIENFHEFKLRLLMALQRCAPDGVPVHDVYRWLTRHTSLSSLARDAGWAEAEVETLHHYNGSPTVYAFHTLDELLSELLCDFDEILRLTPAHEMGWRCPIVVMQVRRR